MPLPADSKANTRSPSSVPVRMCAVVSEPSAYLPLMVNADQRIAVVEFDRRHRADLDSRHRDVVADGEAAGLGEQRLVPERRRPLQSAARAADRSAMTRTIRTTPMKPALMRLDPRYFSISLPRTFPFLA